jgi:hypothetical protein
MMGSFAFPFAAADAGFAAMSRELNAAADAELAMPQEFRGQCAEALAAAQQQRRATLIGLADAAHRAAGYAGTQNVADEALAAAPSPQEVEMARQVVLAMIAGLKTGQVTATEAMRVQQEYGALLAERQLAVTVHAGESERTAGCFGGLYLPEVQARRGGDVPLEEGGDANTTEAPVEAAPKRTDGGDPAATAPTGATPLPEILSPPTSNSLPGAGSSNGDLTAEFPGHGGMVAEFPGPAMPPLTPLNPETGLSGSPFPMTPQLPGLAPMPMPPQQGGMPGGGFGPMPMPGLPMPGGSFTAPPGGRMLDPTPPARREQSRDRDRDTDLTTPDDLDLTLFPDGAAAVAGGVVAGGAVGSSVTGVTTPANVTGVTAPVVSAMPPMNPATGGMGPAAGGMVPPMGAMGSGVGGAGGGGGMKPREPVLAAEGTVGQENLREAVAGGTVGRATAEPPERAAS